MCLNGAVEAFWFEPFYCNDIFVTEFSEFSENI